LFEGKNIAILGANHSALEIAAELCHVCPKVHLIAKKHMAKVFYSGPKGNII
jgi:cation diffusion facilitator CzcD-associated flavoprotein CzcO